MPSLVFPVVCSWTELTVNRLDGAATPRWAAVVKPGARAATTPSGVMAGPITNMTVGFDKIWASSKVFVVIGLAGTDLDASRFAFAGQPTERAPRIFYDDASGALSYDAAGNRADVAVQFAQAAAGLFLTADNLQPVASSCSGSNVAALWRHKGNCVQKARFCCEIDSIH